MKLFIKAGFAHRTNKPFKGETDLEKYIKETLIRFKIRVDDPCCPGPAFVHPFASINATATVTTDQLKTELIKSTSAAVTTMTLPTATILGTALGASQGTYFEFTVDNSAGASVFTVALGTGITAITPVITGSNTLIVAAAAIGQFKIYFSSPTVAKIVRTF